MLSASEFQIVLTTRTSGEFVTHWDLKGILLLIEPKIAWLIKWLFKLFAHAPFEMRSHGLATLHISFPQPFFLSNAGDSCEVDSWFKGTTSSCRTYLYLFCWRKNIPVLLESAWWVVADTGYLWALRKLPEDYQEYQYPTSRPSLGSSSKMGK